MFSTKTSSTHKRSADDAVVNQNNNNVASSSSSTNLFATTSDPLNNNHHDDDIMTNLMGEEEAVLLKGGTDPSPSRKKAKIEGEAPRRSSRRGGGAAAAKTAEEEDVAIMEDAPPVDIEPAPIEPTPVIANAPVQQPPAAPTPKRAAASQVLASLGDTGVKEGEEANPAAMAEVATGEGGGVQHDYLLQNLVQASQVTSPLPMPGKGQKRAAAPPLPPAQAPVAPLAVASPPMADPNAPLPMSPQPTKSRKEKSLGVLCANFMDLFKNAPPNRDNNGTVIEICQISEHLGVKRRRIYDVINILEAIDIVCRVKKNTYRWHGKEGLPKWFADLQKSGIEEIQAKQAAIAAGQDPNAVPSGTAKAKGMAQTCQKLIQLFLVSGRVEIALTDAADEILGPTPLTMDDASRQKITKTKVRRMYDIANVLQAIGVLQKENVGSTSLQNKPSFRWVYPILPQDMANYLGPGSQPASVQPGELMNVGGVAVPASLPEPEPHHVSPEELAAQQAATLPSPLDAPAGDEHTHEI